MDTKAPTTESMEAGSVRNGWKPGDNDYDGVNEQHDPDPVRRCQEAGDAVKDKVLIENGEGLRKALPEIPIEHDPQMRYPRGADDRSKFRNMLLTKKQRFWLYLGKRNWTRWLRDKMFKSSP